MASFLALLHYFHTGYMGSFRYIAPMLLYFGTIAWLYMVGPNPVMSSYGFTSALLYVVSAWMAFGYIDADPETRQIVTALHAQSLPKFAAAKLVYLALFTAACFRCRHLSAAGRRLRQGGDGGGTGACAGGPSAAFLARHWHRRILWRAVVSRKIL